MFPVINYINHYCVFIAVLAAFYIFGAIILQVCGATKKIEGFYSKLFFNIFAGLIAFITVYSVIKTGFKTINLIFFLIGGALLAEKKSARTEVSTPSLPSAARSKYALVLFLGSIFIYSWSFFAIYKGGRFPYVIADYDYIYSSNISYFLGATGRENEFHILNLMSNGYHYLHPYHYFELWLNAGISEITRGLNVITLFLTTFPIFYFISFLGFLAISEYYSLNKFTVLICFLSLFIGGFYLDRYGSSRVLAEGASFNASLMSAFIPKLSYFYIFISGFYLMYLRNQKAAASLILLGLAAASFVACLPLVIGILVFCMLGPKFNLMSGDEAKRAGGYTLVVALAFFLFYYIFNKGGMIPTEGITIKDALIRFYKGLFTFVTFRNRFNISISTVLTVALLYIPLFLPLALSYQKGIKNLKKKIPVGLFMFSMVIFIVGMMLWSAAYRFPDGIALFYHLFIPLMNCSLILAAICLVSQAVYSNRPLLKQQPLIYACVFVYLLASLNQMYQSYKYLERSKQQGQYDNDYMTRIKGYLEDKAGCYGVSIKDKSEYKTIFSKYTTCYALGGYLALFKNGVVPVSISDFDIPIAEKDEAERQRDLDAVSMGIFYRFVENQKRESAFKSVAQSQIDFIDTHKIKYAIVSKAAKISPMIQGRVKQQFEDRFSGELFLIFQ